LIEQLAQSIDRRGWGLPAVLLLQILKPIGFLASQGLLLCEPLINLISEETRVAEYASLLADRASLEQLIGHLEQGATASGVADNGVADNGVADNGSEKGAF
jgi:hypothetical protein